MSEFDRVEGYKDMINKGTAIADIWCAQDVIWLALDRFGIKLSEVDAIEILGDIMKRFDANIGINWDVIEYAVEEHQQAKSL